jgi:16S rRNA processing protein RimM
MASAVFAPGAMVVMGQVLLPWGIRGWLKVRPHTESPDTLLGLASWWLRPPTATDWIETSVVAGRMHSDALVVQLAGIETREAALKLKGSVVAVPRSVLPPPSADEIYQTDLVGLTVVNREGVTLGQVVAVTDFGAHPLLQVRATDAPSGAERLIPYVPAIVDQVDPATRTMRVDWGEDF